MSREMFAISIVLWYCSLRGDNVGVGKKIQELCETKGLSIRKLSLMASVPYSTLYSIIMRDSDGVDGETIKRISEALDVTIDFLYGKTRDPHTRLATQEDIEKFFGGDSYTTKDGVAFTTTPGAVSALTHYFNLLNDEGQAVAVYRVKELSEIPRYKK